LYFRLKARHSERDNRMSDVLLVRQGKMRDVYPDVFPEGPYTKGIVANMIDVSARDLSEVISPMPAINCASASMVSDKARRMADKRTLIAAGYTDYSRLPRQMYKATDRFVTFGFTCALVEPDDEASMPRITFMDSVGCYPLFDRWDRLEAVFFRFLRSRDELVAMYPDCATFLAAEGMSGGEMIEMVRMHDKDNDMLFLPYGEGFQLDIAPNRLGKVCASWIERPSLDQTQHGQFDDVLAVQVAKSRFALLALEAAQKAVQAPIAVPMDILEMPIGSDSVIKSQHPEQIRRVAMEIPPSAFQQQQVLEAELRAGSRIPSARQGDVEGSVITGRGVQALMSGFDTQVRTAQAMFAIGLTELFELAFAMDEKLWPNKKKTLRGNSEGVPFEIDYTPAKDIAGDFTVDVQYGLMAGLDPNRALVFGLQARGDKLVSRDFMRRNLPFNMNAAQEDSKVDIEETRDALKQAVFGYAASLPQMVEQGQDPQAILVKLAMIIADRQKGVPIETAVSDAFAPPPPPPPGAGDPNGDPGSEASDPGLPADGSGPAPGMGAPPGMGGGPLPGMPTARTAPGQVGMPPGGRPDLQSLLVGLGNSGKANLQANVVRKIPTG